MTAIVGVLCKDGVVIGADSAASFGPHPQAPTIEQPTEKIAIIGNSVILAGTGYIGHNQRFCAIVERAWDEEWFKAANPIELEKRLCGTAMEDFKATHMALGDYGAILAFPIRKQAHLVEFAQYNFQPELKDKNLWFVSMGNSQKITDGFLAWMRDVFWPDEMPGLYDGLFAVTWTLQHIINVNAGGINAPMRIAVLESGKKGGEPARLLEDSELAEHHQHIEETKKLLRDFRLKHQGQAGVVSIPQP
jgi:hypothetical protein